AGKHIFAGEDLRRFQGFGGRAAESVDKDLLLVGINQPRQPDTVRHPHLHLGFECWSWVTWRTDFRNEVRHQFGKTLLLVWGQELQFLRIGNPGEVRAAQGTIGKPESRIASESLSTATSANP